MATLDLHLEAPPALVRREEQARFEFNKTIAGHYRNGPNYSKVGVLFLIWEGDDMNCKTKEVGFLTDCLRLFDD